MKTDINGCSTCPRGQEEYEEYTTPSHPPLHLIEYQFRTYDGQLFACCASTLEIARQRRDMWLEKLARVQR